jgi:GH25 family lysozyme M1 (1,4-beta-N-acetylmuramidase)
MSFVFGVDVSSYEPRVDWRALRAQGVRFAFMRATSGIGYVDASFAEHWAGAREAGILRGAYHYMIAQQEPAKQANLFIKTVGSDKGELPPIVDFEDKYNEAATNKRVVDTGKAILDLVEASFGRKPMVYSRRSYFQEHMVVAGKQPAWAKDYPLWVAQYPYVYAEGMMPTPAEGWQPWKFWQYSESGIIEGVTNEIGRLTEIDLNWFRGTVDDLYAFADVDQPEPTQYIVQAGDTFKSIAVKHEMNIEELLNANPDLLKVGSALTIPAHLVIPIDPIDPIDPVDPINPVTYVVKSGDTLGVIAGRFNTTVGAIQAINPTITNPNLIFVGQVIVIP